MKNELNHLYKWLSKYTFDSHWFKTQIMFQIISLTSWFLYPKYRSENNFKDVVLKNRFMITLICVLFLWTSGFFSIGIWVTISAKASEITKLETSIEKVNNIIFNKNKIIEKKDSTIAEISDLKEMRGFIEYKVYRDCKLENYKSLKKMPDPIFYTIIEEINYHKIPYTIFFRLLDQESGFQFVKNKKSKANGVCQVLPSTSKILSKRIGLTGDPEIDNIRMGAFHLKVRYDHYRSAGLCEKESWTKSLMDYNGQDIALAQDNMKFFKKDLF